MSSALNKSIFKIGAGACLSLLLAASPVSAAPAGNAGAAKPAPAKSTPAASSDPTLSAARANFAKANYAAVIKQLSVATTAPTNSEAQYLLGMSYLKTKDLAKARVHLRSATHLGRGSASAQKANLALMAMPRPMISPKTGAQTRMIASMLGIGRTRGIGGAGLPTVIDFYAAWCQPCKQVDTALNKAKATYAEKVSFMRVDVDDPNSQAIMDQYDVSPIPTMVFLNGEGEVVSYSIGFAGDNNIASNIKKLLPPATASQPESTKTATTNDTQAK